MYCQEIWNTTLTNGPQIPNSFILNFCQILIGVLRYKIIVHAMYESIV